MFKRTLTFTLASSFALGMTAFFAPRANAQSAPAADVPFNGNVDVACDFDSGITQGTLANDDNPQVLSSTDAGGSAGSVDITCNTVGATLAIAAPGAGSTPTGVTADSLSSEMDLTGDNTATDIANGSSATLNNMGTTTATVDMTADFSTTYSEVPGGTYNYTVQLTLTP